MLRPFERFKTRARVTDTLASQTWLVIALYNEAPVIGDVVREAKATFPNIVCVDDGSSDGSGDIALEAGAFVVSHPINLGQGAALQTGLEFALNQPGSQYFVTFDADGQHSVEDAQRMVQRVSAEPLDALIGSRFLDNRTKVTALKRFVLRTVAKVESMSTGMKLTDAHNGLRAFNRHAAESIEITQNRMAHASEIVAQIRSKALRCDEEPVHIRYTDYSKAKGQSLWNSVNILSELWLR